MTNGVISVLLVLVPSCIEHRKRHHAIERLDKHFLFQMSLMPTKLICTIGNVTYEIRHSNQERKCKLNMEKLYHFQKSRSIK